jgi:hypothetical protein
MAKNKDASATYIKFLNLVQAVRSQPSFPSMDLVEERLLNMFAAIWHAGKSCTVLEAMEMMPEMSASTVHRRLSTMRKKGLIALDVDAADNRIKYIVATDVANNYFAQLGKCMDKARTE